MTSALIDRAWPAAATVCLVEDHVHLREQLHYLLVDAGMDVLAAVGTVRDGEAAIRACAPDFAVVDNRLPDGRGIDLIRTIALAMPHVTLLLHTAAVTEDQRTEALDAGAAAVILKSIQGVALIEALRLPRSIRESGGPQSAVLPAGKGAPC